MTTPTTTPTPPLPRPAGGAGGSERDVVDLRFPAMSTNCQIVVVDGPPGLAERGADRVAELEDRWTRFRPSELTALNGAAGQLTVVSCDTFRLVEAMVTAWRATGGLFDPTVLRALEASGYDRSIEEVRGRLLEPPAGPTGTGTRGPGAAPGCARIVLHRPTLTVQLPRGVALDPGGLGKGLAADLVAEELRDAGAAGVQVNLGGDTRVLGTPPEGETWVVSIDDPWDRDQELARIELPAGGVATSSRLGRRWHVGDDERHHLLDPATGRPTTTDVVAATAVAGTAWWAEASTKVLLVAGTDTGLAGLRNASAIVSRADGTTVTTPDLDGAVA